MILVDTKHCPKCDRPTVVLWRGREYCIWCDQVKIAKLKIGTPRKSKNKKAPE